MSPVPRASPSFGIACRVAPSPLVESERILGAARTFLFYTTSVLNLKWRWYCCWAWGSMYRGKNHESRKILLSINSTRAVQIRPELGKKPTQDRRLEILHTLTAFFSNYQRAPMTRVIVAGLSVLGFILRMEWSQRSWIIAPVNCNRNVWETNSYTCSSPRILATMLIMPNNGQKNYVSVCGHLSWSDRIKTCYCTSGIDFLHLNNPGQSLSFPARECSAEVPRVRKQNGGLDCVLVLLISGSLTDPLPLGDAKEL